MKNNFITDLIVAIKRAIKRKDIEEASTVSQIPYIDTIKPGIGFLNTAEEIVLYNRSIDLRDKSMYEIPKGFFNKLPEDEKLHLSNLPKDGEFIGRVQFWQTALKPLMSPRQYRIAMTEIIHWYIHIKHIRAEGASV